MLKCPWCNKSVLTLKAKARSRNVNGHGTCPHCHAGIKLTVRGAVSISIFVVCLLLYVATASLIPMATQVWGIVPAVLIAYFGLYFEKVDPLQ